MVIKLYLVVYIYFMVLKIALDYSDCRFYCTTVDDKYAIKLNMNNTRYSSLKM